MSENRNYPRRVLRLPVAYQTGDGPRVEATCRDLSLGGMFIETSSPLAFGTKLSVFVRFPGLERETEIVSTVRWTLPAGMGVQFGAMGARETHGLTELLR